MTVVSPDSALLTITQAVYFTGLSADLLRRYERQGVLPVARSQAGHRLFRPNDLEAAMQIYRARAARHGLTGIRRNLTPI